MGVAGEGEATRLNGDPNSRLLYPESITQCRNHSKQRPPCIKTIYLSKFGPSIFYHLSMAGCVGKNERATLRYSQ